jgi:hypothetical protein
VRVVREVFLLAASCGEISTHWVVATPDHGRAIPTVLGCQAGEHIDVEKPDAHNRLSH